MRLFVLVRAGLWALEQGVFTVWGRHHLGGSFAEVRQCVLLNQPCMPDRETSALLQSSFQSQSVITVFWIYLHRMRHLKLRWDCFRFLKLLAIFMTSLHKTWLINLFKYLMWLVRLVKAHAVRLKINVALYLLLSRTLQLRRVAKLE